MKKNLSSRRGSALLIVLGVLSFMVVSAVAFSVLMRQSRLPSSFMRQKVTSAYLAKAALANAMAQIDEAIGDNPYPGVGTSGGANNWERRVLMLDNSGGGAAVSTLPLEGLAYIPPPLVNTVRYEMKRSPTAVWKTLGYDAGRYAYTAINVSDYMDVNRLRANVMRDCTASNHISIAYMFENDQHTGDGTVSASAFDDFVESVAQNHETRLVSMADYALAIGSGKFGSTGFTSPFYDYITSPTKDGVMYGDDAQIENIRRQKFVTDSWYPLGFTNQTTTTKALTDADNQPFKSGFASNFDELLRDPLNDQDILRHLNLPERVAFMDYLDDDNVPTSLALPTMESAPMLTGLTITPQANTFQFGVKSDSADDIVTPATKDATTGQVKTPKTVQRLWKITGFNGTPQIGASVTAVFPFKRSTVKKINSLTTFPVQMLVKAYLVPEDKVSENTRLEGSFSCRPTSTDAWRNAWLLADAGDPCVTFLGTGSLSLKNGGEIDDEANTVMEASFLMNAEAPASAAYPIFGVKVTDQEDGSTPACVYDGSRLQSAGGLRSVNLTDAGGTAIAGTENAKFRWMFFAWVRVLGENNKTVDLFPACFKDDNVYNGISLGDAASVMPTTLGEPAQEAVVPVKGPLALDLQLAKFVDATNPLTSDLAADNGGGFDATDAKDLMLYCDDPRYNWAPEDWYASSGAISADGWLSRAKTQQTGASCRSHDIFQFISNQGYLQSLGELQFIPLVRKSWSDYQEANPIGTSFCNNTGRYGGQPFANRTGVGNLANADYMWKTYSFFDYNGGCDPDGSDGAYSPYKWGLVDAPDGAVVSPYAEEELMMAALANTPYDYIVTSLAEAGELTLENGGRKYCFSGFSSEAQIDWEDLEKIAAQVKSQILSTDWWAMDAWREKGDTLFGQSVGCKIHDVDRKFLAAYWKNCFANRQQLFLVFVRAEPTVMGAASSGHTPAQLGARAVALVWREPESSVAADGPHRMRVLFYHQFE